MPHTGGCLTLGKSFGTMELWYLRTFLSRTVTRGLEEEDALLNLVHKIDRELEGRANGANGGAEQSERLSA